MALSLREKQSFYDHLAQLLRAGIPFPSAVEKLATTSHGSLRSVLKRLRAALDRGDTVADAFSRLREVGDMERTTVAALARTGRMDRGLQQLSEYFGALDQARREVIKRSTYPLFILHFGVLILNAPLLFSGGGLPAYLRATGSVLFFVYGAAIIVALLVPLLRDAGAVNSTMDRLLRTLPVIGGIRRAFALSRFCGTYDMQLEAGVNVIDSLEAAGRASRSALIQRAARRAVSSVRDGSQVGPLLAQSRAFPEEMIRSFLVAEETGQLDRELPRMTTEYLKEGLGKLSALSEWGPRLMYVGILMYLGWNVVMGYKGYLDTVTRQIDSL